MSTHDKWATPDYVVRAMMDIIQPAQHPHARWLEPSAGDGAIVRGLLRAGAINVTAVEADFCLADKLHEDGLGVQVWNSDFLQWSLFAPHHRYRAVANPPFTGKQTMQHIAAMRAVCSCFWLLAPAGLLEPCQNRGDVLRGLRTVYPAYIRRFRDLTGVDTGSGSRPTFLYEYAQHSGEPTISYAFHERVKAREAEQAKDNAKEVSQDEI